MKTFLQIVLGFAAGVAIFTGIVGLCIDHTSNGRGTAIFLIACGVLCILGIMAIAKKKKHTQPINPSKRIYSSSESMQDVEIDPKLVQRGHEINIAFKTEDGFQVDETPLVGIEYHRIDPDEDRPTPPNAELSYLDYEALKFWNKKHTDYEIPSYYNDTAFGRNVKPALERLLADGYLDIGSIDKNILLKTIPEIKAVLADKGLKLSGNKAELVRRLIDNIDIDELEMLFPVGVYIITPKGERALEPYSIIDANECYALRLSYYRLISERVQHPEESDNDILSRLLSDDINKALKAGNKEGYQEAMLTKGRFLHSIGEDASAFEYYVLSYFMWALDFRKLNLTDHTQCYYQARYIEECGKLCGYSLNDVYGKMKGFITEVNPFGLATGYNVKYTLKLFSDSLGINQGETT